MPVPDPSFGWQDATAAFAIILAVPLRVMHQTGYPLVGCLKDGVLHYLERRGDLSKVADEHGPSFGDRRRLRQGPRSRSSRDVWLGSRATPVPTLWT